MALQEKNTILLIEKSNNLRTVLRDYFELLKYQVKDCVYIITATRTIKRDFYDITILDVGDDIEEGINMMKTIFKMDPNMPIVILSDSSDKLVKIQAFKEGCEDFLSKPFSIEELSLRVNVILKRLQKLQSPLATKTREDIVVEFGAFTFNFSTAQLTCFNYSYTLTRKECDLLYLLVKNVNTIMPRETMLFEVWGEGRLDAGRSMDVYITKLRKYLNYQFFADKAKVGQLTKRKLSQLPKVELVNIHGTGFMLKVED